MSPEESSGGAPPSPPQTDALLTELALRWEELQDQEQAVTLEGLCQDHPDLIEPLRQRIQALRAMDAALEVTTRQIPGEAVDATGSFPNAAAPPERLPAAGAPAPLRRAIEPIPGYEIQRELGRGGMGVVYLARQTGLNRLVALKMILPGRKPRPRELERFRREIETLASLRHPNLVAIYEVGEHEGLPFYSLEYMEEGSLDEWIGERPQPLRLSAELAETLARAMHAAHTAGVIHRDLKPGNVLLSRLEEREARSDKGKTATLDLRSLIPKITDFGLARRLTDAEGPTHTGDVLGTPSYMAPEQALGKSKDVGPAADVYGLGAILYKLLTGRPPFQGDTSWNTIRQVLAAEIVAPRRLQPDVPRDLQTICLKCLEREPAKRYASALDLADDLRRFLANQPVRARPVGPVGRLWRWSRRHPAVALLLAGILAALLVIIVGGAVYNIQLQQALREVKDYAEHNRRGLVHLYVARGARLLDEGDHFRALAWFAEALRLDEGRPEAEAAHRTRLAITLRQCPRLLQLWSHAGPVQQAVFSPDGKLVLTASDDGTARLWDADTGKAAVPPLTHRGPVTDASFRPDGLAVVTASDDGTARVLLTANGLPVTPPLEHGGPVTSAAFDAKGQLLVTTGKNGTARLWDPKSGQPVGAPLQHDGPVQQAAFNHEGTLVVTASDDHTARIWKIKDKETGRQGDKEKEAVILRHQGPVKEATFSPDGRWVLTASADGTAQLWEAATGKNLRTFRHHQAVIQALFSPDGKRVATASDDHTGCVWDADTGDLQGEPLRHRSGLNAIAFSPNGRLVATASDDNSGCVWGAAAGEHLTPLLRHNGSLNAVAFSPDGRRLVTAGNDHLVRVWDLTALPPASSAPLTAPAVEPPPGRWLCADGRHVATKESDLVVRVRDAVTGKPLGPDLTHGSTVKYAAFGPLETRTRLVTASDDDSAYVWNWATGDLLTVPLAHNGSVRYAAFSPDGRFIVTDCDDGTIRVWDSETGQPLTPPLRFGGTLEKVAFDRDGTRLTLTRKSEPPLSWDLRPTSAAVAELRALAELLSGCRIDRDRGSLPVAPERLQAAWQASPSPYPKDLTAP